MRETLRKSEQTVVNLTRRIASFVMLVTLFCAVSQLSWATQTGKPQVGNEAPQQTVQSVVAKQAALVSEFEVNGLKVLMKRREGSLTVAAGLFIRGGATNINASNAGIESLMLSASTEATTGFPREKMRSELSRMGTLIGSSAVQDYSVLSLGCTRNYFDRSWQLFTDVILRP